MIWLTWRQQRTEILMAMGLMGLLASFLVASALSMQNTFHQLGVGPCLGAHPGQACSNIVQTFDSSVASITSVSGWLNFVPLTFALLLGAPLVLELEQGSFRLSWTQSTTRTRWLVIKLLTIAALTVVFAVACTELMTFWRIPLDRIGGSFAPNDGFDLEGLLPPAYGLFAVAVGLSAGAVLRRTVPAAVISIAVFLPVRLAFQTFVRPYLQSPVKMIVPMMSPLSPAHGAWIMTSTFSDRHGHVLPNSSPIFAACAHASGAKGTFLSCLNAHHVFSYTVYQPGSRFWAFQGMEAGIFTAVALILFVFVFWFVKTKVS